MLRASKCLTVVMPLTGLKLIVAVPVTALNAWGISITCIDCIPAFA